MSYIQGQIIEVPFTVVDTDTRDPVDPTTLHFLIKGPDGEIVDLEYPEDGIAKVDTGSFVGTWIADQAGRYLWRAVSTGTGQGALQGYVDVEAAFAVSYAPAVEDLAGLLPARTGQRLTGPEANRPANSPPFTDAARVQQVIDMATSLVTVALGSSSLPAKFHSAARYLIVLKAAMLLEPSAWPEQARPDKSSWEQWKDQYEADLAELKEAIVNDAVDGNAGDGGPDAASRVSPLWSFPPACGEHIESSECAWPSTNPESWC